MDPKVKDSAIASELLKADYGIYDTVDDAVREAQKAFGY